MGNTQKRIKRCIWSVAIYGSETWTVGKNEERVVNAFKTWSGRGMLKLKWTDRIWKDEVFQRAQEEKLLLKILKIDATHGYGKQLGITSL